MNNLFTVSLFITLGTLMVFAEPPSYGPPSSGGSFGSNSEGGQTHKYVSVHIAPEDGAQEESRVIRVPGGGDKHVNIIFVKTKSGSEDQQTEVILPEQPVHKNIVYILTKKPSAKDGIKIRKPAKSAHVKPEVFFIRYKQDSAQSDNPESQQAYVPSSGHSITTGTSYGTPF